MEAWHCQLNSQFSGAHPKLSVFTRIIVKEDDRWHTIIDDFTTSPANGIRGLGIKRKEVYVNNDNNLRQLYNNAANNQHDPIVYLRSIAHHL
jgi:hypothetical protein